MRYLKAIIAGISGTTAFTIFSYSMSEKAQRNYREPELLGRVAMNILRISDRTGGKFYGWLFHYFIGIAFSMFYDNAIMMRTSKNYLFANRLSREH